MSEASYYNERYEMWDLDDSVREQYEFNRGSKRIVTPKSKTVRRKRSAMDNQTRRRLNEELKRWKLVILCNGKMSVISRLASLEVDPEYVGGDGAASGKVSVTEIFKEGNVKTHTFRMATDDVELFIRELHKASLDVGISTIEIGDVVPTPISRVRGY